MFGICLRYAASYDEAQDILQEGFVKVFTHLGSFRGKGSLEGWMKRIFLNTAIGKYRERVYHLNVEEAEVQSIGTHRNPEPDMLHLRDILGFVQELPVQYRLVFNLYAIEGYTHKEIANALNISESTSRSNLARARVLLKKKLSMEQQLVLRAI